ncbi:MAG: hypothetical protein AAF682_14935 [Planctomycetota bacterium]
MPYADDRGLLEGLRAEDPDAWSVFYDRYYETIRGLLRRQGIRFSPASASELRCDVIEAFLERVRGGDVDSDRVAESPRGLLGYIQGICSNLARRRARERAAVSRGLDTDYDGGAVTSDEVELAVVQAQIHEAFRVAERELPVASLAVYKAALGVGELVPRTHREIGASFGYDEWKTSRELAKVRNRLRAALFEILRSDLTDEERRTLLRRGFDLDARPGSNRRSANRFFDEVVAHYYSARLDAPGTRESEAR